MNHAKENQEIKCFDLQAEGTTNPTFYGTLTFRANGDNNNNNNNNKSKKNELNQLRRNSIFLKKKNLI